MIGSSNNDITRFLTDGDKTAVFIDSGVVSTIELLYGVGDAVFLCCRQVFCLFTASCLDGVCNVDVLLAILIIIGNLVDKCFDVNGVGSTNISGVGIALQ